MRTRTAWTLLLFSLVVLPGCSVFRVHQGSEKIKGIPFYTKVGKLKQATTWSRTWLEVEISLSDLDPTSGKKSNTETAILQIPEKSATADALNKGTAAAQKEAATSGSIGDTVEAFKTGSKITPLDINTILTEGDATFPGPPISLFESLVSNTTDLIAEVDYTKLYTYNAFVPVFGSAEASIELAADGSLTKASSKADTGKLADELPIAALLTKAFGLAAAAGLTATVPTKELTVSITRHGYLYTLTKLRGPDAPRNQNPLKFGEQDAIVRTELGADTGQKKDPGKKATFEGSVSLPKE